MLRHVAIDRQLSVEALAVNARAALRNRLQTEGEENNGLLAFGVCHSYPANAEIFAQGDHAEKLCQVVSGAVRATQLLPDGRRQITGFYLPGDVFGLEAGAQRGYAAEAIGATTLKVARRSGVMERAHSNPAAAGELCALTGEALERARRHMVALGRRSAIERVAGFLLDMQERAGKGVTLTLPMSRQDIADYLGLTIETVSRSMTQLEQEGLISMTSARRIRLDDQFALRSLVE